MKTIVKIKDLLKLYNPSEQEVTYHDEKFVVNFEEIKKYIESPRTHNVFSVSENNETRLYKNVALYIINANEDKKYIALDFDSEYPIQNGLFEFIKAIYEKQKEIVIDIPEVGNNLLFIKSKKLQSVELDSVDEHSEKTESIVPASDKELANLNLLVFTHKSDKLTEKNSSTIEDEEPKPNVSNVVNPQNAEKVVKDNQFFWKEDNSDNYNNLEFVLEKLKQVTSKNYDERYHEASLTAALEKFFVKVNPDLLNSDEFKLGFLDLNNDELYNTIFNKPRYKSSFILNFDFQKKAFTDKIKELIDKKEFKLLNHIYNNYYNTSNSYYYDYHQDRQEKPHPIDFNYYFNLPNVVEYLTDKTVYSYNKDYFCLKNVYKYLSLENKTSEPIYTKFLKEISDNERNSTTYDKHRLFELPTQLLENEKIFFKLLPSMDILRLHKKFEKENVKHALLTDRRFIENNINSFHLEQIKQIFSSFLKPEDCDKDFVTLLATSSKDIYEKYDRYHEYSTRRDSSNITKLLQDIDVMYKAYSCSSTKLKSIPFDFIKPHLFSEHNEDIEEFKLNYVLNSSLHLYPKDVTQEQEELVYFKKKYCTLENMFLSGYKSENKSRDRALNKLKKEEIELLLEKISNDSNRNLFDSVSFFNALNTQLQHDISLLKKVDKLSSLTYKNLPEHSQYNKEIIFYFLENKHNTVEYVPQEFFNDLNFSLRFAKILDNNPNIVITKMPTFISKFFENQEVTSNYYDYLNSYITMNKLKDDLSSNQVVKKRNKI